jgi:short-subunit dehydrogenase involved in D-alanine esterification of teichoic acids
MLSESVRLQLADTSVKVMELVPPSVRTGLLPDQQTNENAMPLDQFISEVMALLESQPDAVRSARRLHLRLPRATSWP